MPSDRQAIWRLVAVLIAAAGVIAAVASGTVGHGDPKWIVAGASYVGAGAYALYRQPGKRVGGLLVLTGLGIWSSLAQATRVPLLWTAGSSLEALWLPVLAVLLLSFPEQRVARFSHRLMVVMCLTLVVVANVAGSFLYDPRDLGCADCQPGLNLLLVHPSAEYVVRVGPVVLAAVLTLELLVALGLARGWRTAAAAAGALGVLLGTGLALAPEGTLVSLRRVPTLALLLVALAGLLVGRWWRASSAGQRVLGPLLLPALALLLSIAAQQLIATVLSYTSVFQPSPYLFTLLTDIAVVASVFLPLCFLLGLARAHVRRGVVADLIVALGELPTVGELERLLAQTLRDPSLRVGRWDPTAGSYLLTDGSALPIQDADALGLQGAGTTLVHRDGAPLAAITHDRALLADQDVLAAAAIAARFLLEHHSLEEELRQQLQEVRASRARVVSAADVERRRLERDLHDGAQQQLVSLCLDLTLASAQLNDPDAKLVLDEACVGLRAAIGELRELAHGIQPAVLTEQGLGPALQALADRARTPTCVRYDVSARPSPLVETSAYYVAAESLTNVAKHAGASTAQVVVTDNAGRLRIEVIDDGVGGADIAGGTGLRGLMDRVGAVDGHLRIRSVPGEGTRVVAELPCG